MCFSSGVPIADALHPRSSKRPAAARPPAACLASYGNRAQRTRSLAFAGQVATPLTAMRPPQTKQAMRDRFRDRAPPLAPHATAARGARAPAASCHFQDTTASPGSHRRVHAPPVASPAAQTTHRQHQQPTQLASRDLPHPARLLLPLPPVASWAHIRHAPTPPVLHACHRPTPNVREIDPPPPGTGTGL